MNSRRSIWGYYLLLLGSPALSALLTAFAFWLDLQLPSRHPHIVRSVIWVGLLFAALGSASSVVFIDKQINSDKAIHAMKTATFSMFTYLLSMALAGILLQY